MSSKSPIRPATAADRDAVLALLESEEHLETGFAAPEFLVATEGARLVGCARLRPLGQGIWELASVVVARELRGTGLGTRLTEAALQPAHGTVYALALQPGFFARFGFTPLDAVPAPLLGKATSVCASAPYVPMALRRP